MKTTTQHNPTDQPHASIHRQFLGLVVSVKEEKTIHVSVDTIVMHPIYRKQYVKTRKYAVHDEKKQAALGDRVLFEECRPLSKTKRWRLTRIVQ